jgi:cytochrome c peroxidase
LQKQVDVRRRVLAWTIGILGAIAASGGVLGQSAEPISPLPAQVQLDAKKVVLGDKLFHDRRLSKDNSSACSSCHDLTMGGADGRVSSLGINNAKGSINAPTVFNSGFNFRQFWDGRADSLEDQINFPVNDPNELGSNWQEVIAKLAKDAALSKQFQEIYPDGVQAKNVRDAIATFERSLVTPNSKFDRHLRGEKAALDAEETKGYQLFKNYGCIACHQGVNVGGNMFQKFGVMNDYFAKRGRHIAADLGRFNITKIEEDKHVFKVPSLRNVALTAPYFHDGSAPTLDEAVEVMFRYQLGRSAPPEDKRLIVKFLRTLTGEYKSRQLAQQQ